MRSPTIRLALAVVIGLATGTSALHAVRQPGSTQELAKTLTDLMQQQKLDAAAAQIDEDTFVAALFYPETELLVVSAKYSAPTLLVQKLAEKNYRDIYMDLAAASVAETKVLVEDLKADGIRPDRDGDAPFDIVTKGGTSVNFDGDAAKANLSPDDYAKLFKETEATYTRDLQALIAQLQKAP
jgi:hypothetical protein